MNLRLITAPVNEPVSLETAKSFLRVDGNEDDVLINLLIKAAREKGEELSRRAFITQTWEMVIDAWQDSFQQKILRPPLQSITSVAYIDSDNVEHAWTDYVVNNRSEPGTVIFKSLPGSSLQKSGAIVIRFVAGYGNTESLVPDQIKAGILMLLAHWYEHREAVNVGNIVSEVPMSVKQIFLSQRVVWF